MPYRKEKFITGEIYHIIIRAIDENVIFKNIDDHYRGIFSIYEFNTTKPVTIQLRRKLRLALKKKVRQLKDGGIVKFMSKLGTGYGGYFNKKYSRKGHVFQNNFKAVHVKSDEQLKIVWAYIHANSISLIEPKWKERGLRNFAKVIKFLEKYKWSSYLDYIGVANFPSVTERNFILELFGGEKRCKEFLENYIKYRGRVKESPGLLLE